MYASHVPIHPSSIHRTKFAQYESLFRSVSSGHVLTGLQARPVLASSGLSVAILRTIWDLSDLSRDGCLDLQEFAIAMHLVDCVKLGFPLPAALSQELIASARAGGLQTSTTACVQEPFQLHAQPHSQQPYIQQQQQQQPQPLQYMQPPPQLHAFPGAPEALDDDFGDFESGTQGGDEDFGDFESAFVPAEAQQVDVPLGAATETVNTQTVLEQNCLPSEPVSIVDGEMPAIHQSLAQSTILDDLLLPTDPTKAVVGEVHGHVKGNIVSKAVHMLDLFAEESKPKPKLRDLMRSTPTKVMDPQLHQGPKPSSPSKAYDVFTKLVQEDLGIVDATDEQKEPEDEDFGNFEVYQDDDQIAAGDAEVQDSFGDFASAFTEEVNPMHVLPTVGQSAGPLNEERLQIAVHHNAHGQPSMEFKLNPVQYLTELGFDSKMAAVALERCDWNTEAAANWLLTEHVEVSRPKGNETLSSEDEFGEFEEYNEKEASNAEHAYPMPQYIDQQGERLFDWSLVEDGNAYDSGESFDVSPKAAQEQPAMKGAAEISRVFDTGNDVLDSVKHGAMKVENGGMIAGQSGAGVGEMVEDDFGEFGAFEGENVAEVGQLAEAETRGAGVLAGGGEGREGVGGMGLGLLHEEISKLYGQTQSSQGVGGEGLDNLFDLCAPAGTGYEAEGRGGLKAVREEKEEEEDDDFGEFGAFEGEDDNDTGGLGGGEEEGGEEEFEGFETCDGEEEADGRPQGGEGDGASREGVESGAHEGKGMGTGLLREEISKLYKQAELTETSTTAMGAGGGAGLDDLLDLGVSEPVGGEMMTQVESSGGLGGEFEGGGEDEDFGEFGAFEGEDDNDTGGLGGGLDAGEAGGGATEMGLLHEEMSKLYVEAEAAAGGGGVGSTSAAGGGGGLGDLLDLGTRGGTSDGGEARGGGGEEEFEGFGAFDGQADAEADGGSQGGVLAGEAGGGAMGMGLLHEEISKLYKQAETAAGGGGGSASASGGGAGLDDLLAVGTPATEIEEGMTGDVGTSVGRSNAEDEGGGEDEDFGEFGAFEGEDDNDTGGLGGGLDAGEAGGGATGMGLLHEEMSKLYVEAEAAAGGGGVGSTSAAGGGGGLGDLLDLGTVEGTSDGGEARGGEEEGGGPGGMGEGKGDADDDFGEFGGQEGSGEGGGEEDFGDFGAFEEVETFRQEGRGDNEAAGMTGFNLDDEDEDEEGFFGYRDEGEELKSSGSLSACSSSRPVVDQSLRARMLGACMEELKTCCFVLKSFMAAAGAEQAKPELQEELLRSSRMETYISGAAALSSVASRLAWTLKVPAQEKDELYACLEGSGIKEWRRWWEAQVGGEQEAAYRESRESCVVCGVGMEIVERQGRAEERKKLGASEELVCHGRCLAWGLRYWQDEMLKLEG